MLKKIIGLTAFSCSVITSAYAEPASTPATAPSNSQASGAPPTSYMPVIMQEPFQTVMKRMSAAKDAINKKQQDLLNQRYDLTDNPSQNAKM